MSVSGDELLRRSKSTNEIPLRVDPRLAQAGQLSALLLLGCAAGTELLPFTLGFQLFLWLTQGIGCVVVLILSWSSTLPLPFQRTIIGIVGVAFIEATFLVWTLATVLGL